MSFFGRNLRHIRTRKNQTAASFAQEIGVWEDTLRKYELGKAEPDFDTLAEISEKLNLSIDHLLKRDIGMYEQRIAGKKIRLVLLDVDGTLTDGGMYYNQTGDQLKKFDVKDGLAIHRAITRHGMKFGFISSGSADKVIRARAEALGVQFVHAGKEPKIEVAARWISETGIGFEHIAYLGDDLNDLGLLKKVSLSACPADAARQIKSVVDIVLTRKGGEGCVREFLEDVLEFDITK
ncbi:MAG: helix-turn-helix domain-containing protein [Bacteroidia bacterium]|nr:helix-turn-helix domain-containing protein [Bacteroidia bacterium]